MFSCSLLRGLDMEKEQHVSRSYMGYLISPSLWQICLADMFGIPTAVVSGLTLNISFSTDLPYRFSAIYFSAMWTATAPSATAVTTSTERLRPHVAHGVNAGNVGLRGLSGHDIAAAVQRQLTRRQRRGGLSAHADKYAVAVHHAFLTGDGVPAGGRRSACSPGKQRGKRRCSNGIPPFSACASGS